jgi:methylated-DNA-[protein]-cysteine S-methyltransferase
MTTTWTTYDSPLGTLTLVGGAAGLTALHFPDEDPGLDDADRSDAPFADALRQLDAYFEGGSEGFDLALDPGGTSFQREVWDALKRIPPGSTTTYVALARSIGRPAAVRAVGAAVGRTPVPIVMPCHRVLGSDGSLTGYRGGLAFKRALLERERTSAIPPR